ncbi:hypothetical protein [Clostridium beijerinckii]|uniref:hypothetical protein n=1 Tax=Clostridium beijerinckii TaxID=1520 RepID=UPI001360D963|nr:hypothetical protein [Clostridium beijerinckii]MZK53148.1 hypothetical protein [Clostridium beijerinckii]MZK61214.1 hypothetical protein [Clostridium beijerinckii]MZK71413.1 hypothetical protein [Clostridium beijerinckii]MZK76815.1 hypothetical protein [Clostridium beijerinckii]MZK86480.1 hypothetical protein [Clostridium beijerinckii]
MLSRQIPQYIKEKVYKATQKVFEAEGKVENEKVKALLEEDYRICFFNMAKLEELIKEGLDEQLNKEV